MSSHIQRNAKQFSTYFAGPASDKKHRLYQVKICPVQTVLCLWSLCDTFPDASQARSQYRRSSYFDPLPNSDFIARTGLVSFQEVELSKAFRCSSSAASRVALLISASSSS